MPSDAQKKAYRLVVIEHMLWQAPRGLTTHVLAERLGVSRRTIQRDLLDMQGPTYPVKLVEHAGRWSLMAGSQPRLGALRFSLQEGTALALAARLLQHASDEQNPFVAAALAKLGSVLPPPMERHLSRLAEVRSSVNNPVYVRHFEVFAEGWGRQRTVRIGYQPAWNDEHVETDLDVYCLEPSAPSYAFYAIGYSHHQRGLRTYKLERVESADLTDRFFERDPAFDPVTYLGSGWGIWSGSELQTVRLRFAPEAVRRLSEGRFHHTEHVELQQDGTAIVSYLVAEPLEMLSFIRGWGAAVEVLEPTDLRQRVGRDAAATVQLYGMGTA